MTTRYDVSGVPLQGGYIAKRCPVRIQNDILRPTVPLPPGTDAQLRMAQGNDFEASVVEELKRVADPTWVFLDAGLEAAAAIAATMAAAGDGAPVIVGGWLPPDERGRRTGKPDLLVRYDGGYLPVDIKHHRTLDATDEGEAALSALASPVPDQAQTRPGWIRRKHKDDALQLAHYRRMLEAAGLAAATSWAGIIGKEREVVWYDLDEPLWQTPAKSDGRKRKTRTTMEVYDFEFSFRLDIAAVAALHLTSSDADLLVLPVRCDECPDCPWRDHCNGILAAGSGDPSLLPGIGYPAWRTLRDRGVNDRAGVAALSYQEALAEGPAFLPAAILHARAALGDHPVYRQPGSRGDDLPRGDIEVDVDMENTNDGVYLWGVLVTDRAATGLVEEGYRAFVTWDPLTEDAEAAVFDEFWTWLSALQSRVEGAGATFRAYCWFASAENTQLRRLAARSATLAQQVASFITSDRWVDLEQVFRESWLTGGSRSLKVIAPLAGYRWPVDDPGGALSMVKHAEATGGGEQAAARDWLLTYNRGDVEATRAIRDWLDREGAGWPEVPTW
jgi:predicted RecB family nuclease